MSSIKLKCVAVGDGFVGKTSLLARLVGEPLRDDYIATIFDNSLITVKHKEQIYEIMLIDTAGQEEFSNLRKQFYENVDIFLVCFSVDSEFSFENVITSWLPEIQEYSDCNILIGTKCDLRNDQVTIDRLNEERKIFIANTRAIDFAKSHKMIYVECSASKQTNIKEIQNAIVEAYLNKQHTPKSNSRFSSWYFSHLKRIFCCCNYNTVY